MIHDWWTNRYNERYWLEVTGRKDIGVNLKAPQTNEQGKEFWSYSLLKYVQPGDIVFHYDRPNQAIVGRSEATGQLWEDAVVWAARGTSARTARIQPHPRSGWYVGLEHYLRLKEPINLGQIRSGQAMLHHMHLQLASLVGEPLYFPFELGERRPLRPMQGYLFKLPYFFVEHFIGISSSNRASIGENKNTVGSTYRPADEEASVGQRDPFSVDPTLVERALRSHAVTQNALATYLRNRGIDPRSPKPDEPNFDLAWTFQATTWVAEVKSLTEANEEKQLRLGLGQLLRYRHLLAPRGLVQAVLVIEHQPSDPTWETLCEELDILLIWPETWSQKLSI